MTVMIFYCNSIFMYSRANISSNLGRIIGLHCDLFAPIFYFNCEHFHFVFKTKTNKKVNGFYKKKSFLNFNGNRIFYAHFWNFDHA